MGEFQIILEQAAFSDKKVSIKTKERGIVSGIFLAPDEFDTDPDRYGFQIETGEHELDIVFLDEITEIITLPSTESKGFVQLTAKLVSGE